MAPLVHALVALLLAAEPVRAAGARKCGVERWDVKTMADPAASRVDVFPEPETVTRLALIDPPAPRVKGRERRGVWPEEFQTYVVEGIVIVAKPEPDSDVHIAIEDDHPPVGGSEPLSLIVELAHPDCARTSLALGAIATARDELVEILGGEPTRGRLKALLGRRVRVIGVGFFDKIHGQSGRAPNGVELHPVLGFELADEPPPAATDAPLP